MTWLNKENISRSNEGVEYHPLIPFLPENARVLFLGSFPPQRKRWCMDFYYPNFINDHWRIEGQIFFGDKNHFVDTEHRRFKIDEIIAFCQEKGIAFYDTSTAVRRLKDNASDKFLEVVEPTDILALIARLPHLRAIVTTGEKATETICTSLDIPEIPKVNTYIKVPNDNDNENDNENFNRLSVIENSQSKKNSKLSTLNYQLSLYRLPSSSRAYPLAFDKKVACYRQMFSKALMLPSWLSV